MTDTLKTVDLNEVEDSLVEDFLELREVVKTQIALIKADRAELKASMLLHLTSFLKASTALIRELRERQAQLKAEESAQEAQREQAEKQGVEPDELDESQRIVPFARQELEPFQNPTQMDYE